MTAYPFSLPLVDGIVAAGGLALGAGVTFVVGNNGSGKSTLLEAVAIAIGGPYYGTRATAP